ncbi:class II lanthipeptide, LchA2/BrtA2 family [Bacillus thuringiensis]|uniref:class II lanthipeptide, LchA2/BrtA2 family n=1 Tax=Bacillus thuringiensis TaxID=1428 RepID=UPI0030CA3383
MTGLIESELEEHLSGESSGAGTPAIVTAISAVTAVTAQSPCPTSACSKSCNK